MISTELEIADIKKKKKKKNDIMQKKNGWNYLVPSFISFFVKRYAFFLLVHTKNDKYFKNKAWEKKNRVLEI